MRRCRWGLEKRTTSVHGMNFLILEMKFCGKIHIFRREILVDVNSHGTLSAARHCPFLKLLFPDSGMAFLPSVRPH
jgi:hypothetical protein